LCLPASLQNVLEHAALLAILLLLLLACLACFNDADDILLQLSLSSKALREPKNGATAAAEQQQRQRCEDSV
jgi:hypothetical protein